MISSRDDSDAVDGDCNCVVVMPVGLAFYLNLGIDLAQFDIAPFLRNA